MELLVDRITAEPERHTFETREAWRTAHLPGPDSPGEPAVEALAVSLEAYRMGVDLHLDGVVEGETALTCGRCLARYRAPVRERFRLVLEPAGERVPADPEGAESLASDGLYLSEELEAGWFRGSEIHLDRFVAELVTLGLPVQPVCREECRGLCPRCGVDRNVESCDCAEERPRSPFAVLEKLRGPGPADEGEAR